MSILQALIGNENFVLTWDLAVVISIFIAVFLYSFGVNRKKLHMFILSIYAGFVLIFLFPFWNEINPFVAGLSQQLISLALFLGFIVIINFVLSGSIFKISFPKLKNKPIFQIILLSTSAAGFLTSLIFSGMFDVFGGNLSTLTYQFFAQDIAQFAWATAPVFAILASRKTSKGEH